MTEEGSTMSIDPFKDAPTGTRYESVNNSSIRNDLEPFSRRTWLVLTPGGLSYVRHGDSIWHGPSDKIYTRSEIESFGWVPVRQQVEKGSVR